MSRVGRDKQALRLWLGVLGCTRLIEQEVRSRLRHEYGVTLPQFDVLAELDRAGEPVTMSALSRELMVSNGNVTGVVDRLERDGLVERRTSARDRRVIEIVLTGAGRALFARMASDHERWVGELAGGLPRNQMDRLVDDLKDARSALRERLPGSPP